MTEPEAAQWDGSLESLFAVLDEACRTGIVPRRLDLPGPPEGAAFFTGANPPGGEDMQPELFAAPEAQGAPALNRGKGPGGSSFPLPEYTLPLFPDLRHSPSAALLREVSADAFDAVVHAWMSELPIGAEILCFAWTAIAAARREAFRAGPPGRPGIPAEAAGIPDAASGPDTPQTPGWAALPEARRGAEKAASNRGAPETRAVLEAAYKTGREIDRLRGLLRFSPCFPGGDPGGAVPAGGSPGGPVYVARCAPDHHVLPGLADHFTQRFGDCPWAIIDEKRRLVLAGEGGGEARLFPLGAGQSPVSRGPAPDYDKPPDYWEALWRNYHRTINNPARNNPALQRQFMPRRYWKYLTELQ